MALDPNTAADIALKTAKTAAITALAGLIAFAATWLHNPSFTLNVNVAGLSAGGGTPPPPPPPPPPPNTDDTKVLSLAGYTAPDLSALSGSFFPGSSPAFGADISALPVHANSAAIMATIGAAKVHSDFDSNGGDGFLPMLVDASTPLSTVSWLANDNKSASPGAAQSDAGPYPIPATGIFQEAGAVRDDPNFQRDHHVLLVDITRKKMWDLYQLRHLSDKGWVAYSGAVFDLTKPLPQRPAGWTSSDAAGLPITPYLVFKAEIDAAIADGSFCLKHPLRCTFGGSATRYAFQAPATHAAANPGTANVPSRAPFGTLIRMKAAADISALKAPFPVAFTILNTFKKRGAYLADNGSDGFVFYSGAYDGAWDDGSLIRTTGFLASANFEIVDDGQAATVQP